MALFIIALSIVFAGFAPQQHPQVESDSAVHYRVYRADGTPSSLEEIEAALKDTDVLFVGESHNDPIVHYLQRELLDRAFRLRADQESGVALSMEMFTRDVQYIMDEYLEDLVTESQFLAASAPWNNYESDYRPLVEFAKENELDVVAANAPRRYANRVSRLGRESLNDLSEKALSYLAPLPYSQASELYAEQFAKAMQEAMEEMAANPPKPAVEASSDCDCKCECPMAAEVDHAAMMKLHHGEGEMEEGVMEHGEGEVEMDHAAMMKLHHGEGEMEEGVMEHGEGEVEMDHAAMMKLHHGEGEGEMDHAAMMKLHHGEGVMEHGEGEENHTEMDNGAMMKLHHGEGEGEMEEGVMEHGEGEENHTEMNHGEGEDEGEMDHPTEEQAATEDAAPTGHGMAGGMPNISQILDSQSLWDATMAYAISEYRKMHPNSLVMHVVGSFHVQTGTGIPEHLSRYAPGTKTVIISVEPTMDVNTFDATEHENLGDFVILSDESLPRTFDSTP